MKKELSVEELISFIETHGNQVKVSKFLNRGISTIYGWRHSKKIPPKIIKKFEEQQENYDDLLELLEDIRAAKKDSNELEKKLETAEKKVKEMLAKLLIVK